MSASVDPWTVPDTLAGAQLLDIHVDVLTGVLGMLFELRRAKQLREANTGVLVARGVSVLSWHGYPRQSMLSAWPVDRSTSQVRDGQVELNLLLRPAPGAQLRLIAETAAFVMGDVPGLCDAPSDYAGRAWLDVSHNVATWQSEFDPISATYYDPIRH